MLIARAFAVKIIGGSKSPSNHGSQWSASFYSLIVGRLTAPVAQSLGIKDDFNRLGMGAMVPVSRIRNATVAELKVETPEGTREWVITLFREYGSPPLNKILLELRKIVKKNL